MKTKLSTFFIAILLVASFGLTQTSTTPIVCDVSLEIPEILSLDFETLVFDFGLLEPPYTGFAMSNAIAVTASAIVESTTQSHLLIECLADFVNASGDVIAVVIDPYVTLTATGTGDFLGTGNTQLEVGIPKTHESWNGSQTLSGTFLLNFNAVQGTGQAGTFSTQVVFILSTI